MFFVLSKVLFYLLMPAVWMAGVLIYALFVKDLRKKKIAITAVLGMFLFFGNIGIVNYAFLCWEPEPTTISTMPQYDVGIVLTGVTNHDKKPHDRVYFHRGADRLLHTVQLYKVGKLKNILITGGSGRVTGESISEATDMKKVFLLCGVPDSVLFIETDSRNTRENAVNTKRMLDSLGLNGSKLLITSAFHMPRALGCFDKVGLNVDSFPVDFYGGETTSTPDVWIIPNESAYSFWHTLIHEWIGYVVYKVMGYSS